MKKYISLLLLGASLTMQAQHGTLDPTFGDEGVRLIDYAGGLDANYGLALQSNGKIVLCGFTDSESDAKWDASVTRLNDDGSTDVNFGIDGWYRINRYTGSNGGLGYDRFSDLTLLADGSIIAVGCLWIDGINTNNPSIDGLLNTLIVKLKSDGTPDESFGDAGVVLFDLSENTLEYAWCVEHEASTGKIYVGGKKGTDTNYGGFILRLLADGTLDTTFATNGIWNSGETTNNEVEDIALLPNGDILATGFTGGNSGESQPIIYKLKSNGTSDITFGSFGSVLPFAVGQYQRILPFSDNNGFYIAAYENLGAGNVLVVRSFDSKGKPITTFGNNGLVTYGSGASYGHDISYDYQGMLLVSGTFNNQKLGVIRIEPATGELDESWGDQGLASASFQGVGGLNSEVLVDNEGRVIVCGTYQAGVINNNQNWVVLRFDSFTDLSVSTQMGSCHDANDGGLTISPFSGTAPYTYSIDGSIYQSGPSFSGLTAGNYDVYVKDNGGTVFSLMDYPLVMPEPISFTISASPDKTQMNVLTSGGTPPYMYSIDGVNFQSSPSFSGLTTTVIEVSIKDANDCLHVRMVDLDLGIAENTLSQAVRAYPNPVGNELNIDAEGKRINYITVYDLKGQLIHQQQINDVRCSVNTSAWASGLYTIKLEGDFGQAQLRVLK